MKSKPIEGKEPKKTITEETLNSRKAIWQRPKNEVTDEEYKDSTAMSAMTSKTPRRRFTGKSKGRRDFAP